MIFVTVGMHTAPFDRLISAMDSIAATIDEPVIMQIGCARIEPHHAEWFRFAPYEDMQSYCERARVVVCQGATSILVALHAGTPVIAVPRRREFGEHIDDHQVMFVAKMAERALVTAADNVCDLANAIAAVQPVSRDSVPAQHHALVDFTRAWLT